MIRGTWREPQQFEARDKKLCSNSNQFDNKSTKWVLILVEEYKSENFWILPLRINQRIHWTNSNYKKFHNEYCRIDSQNPKIFQILFRQSIKILKVKHEYLFWENSMIREGYVTSMMNAMLPSLTQILISFNMSKFTINKKRIPSLSLFLLQSQR